MLLFDIDWQGTQQLYQRAGSGMSCGLHPAALGSMNCGKRWEKPQTPMHPRSSKADAGVRRARSAIGG